MPISNSDCDECRASKHLKHRVSVNSDASHSDSRQVHDNVGNASDNRHSMSVVGVILPCS